MSKRNTFRGPNVKEDAFVEVKPEEDQSMSDPNDIENSLDKEGRANNTFFLRSEPNMYEGFLTSNLVYIYHKVHIVGEKGVFYKIIDKKGIKGYAPKKFIEVM